MDDKLKQIYKENLTYSLYGIIVIIVVLIWGGLNQNHPIDYFLSGMYISSTLQWFLFCIIVGGVRGYFLTQKLNK